MSNFVDDDLDLANFPKTDLTAPSGDPTKRVAATDMNDIRQAMLDIKSVLRTSTRATLLNPSGGTVAACNAVYSSAAGSFAKAKADAGGTSRVIGITIAAIGAAASGLVQSSGPVTATTAAWDAACGTSGGLTFGTRYYLSAATAGLMTATAPVTNGQYVAPVLLGLSATVGLVLLGEPALVGAASSVTGTGTNGSLTRYTGSATLGNAGASDDGAKTSIPYLVQTGAWRNTNKFVTPQMQSTATGVVNDFKGGTLATWQASSYIGLDSAGGNSTISGFDATGAVNGEMKILHHNGDGNSGDAEVGTITLLHQTSPGATGSATLNRMWLPANMDMILEPGDCVILFYDEFRWRILGKSGGAVNSLKIRKTAYNDRLDIVTTAGSMNDLGYNAGDAVATANFQRYTLLRLDTTAGAVNITGIFAPPQVANTGSTVRSQSEEKIIVNMGAGLITFKHANGGSIGDDQFWLVGSADSTLATFGVARFIYDWTSKKWLRVT